MNLMKWFRKNKTKVLAVVVIVILFGFIGGGTLLQQLTQRTAGPHKTIAYFADKKKITNYDFALANRELKILKELRVDKLLRRVGSPVFRDTPDLQAVLLSELLFAERATSPDAISGIKQIIRMNRYRITDKQINDIYRHSMPSYVYWLLLRNEAQLAGIRISNEQAHDLLGREIPKLFSGVTYQQLIGSIINQHGIPEEEILTTFSKLLGVFSYARLMCSGEDVTAAQIMHNVSLEQETIDVEFVKFDSAVFAETVPEPNEGRITEHFDKYKEFFAGAVSEENPYGFGYKQPNRVKLQYIAVRLDDVSEIVTPPTQEEIEEYYRKHRELFTEQVLSDPNDPNSQRVKRIKTYAEVAGSISNLLAQSRINWKTEEILQEAKALTEAGLQDIDTELENLSTEQFKAMAGDYETAAEQLTKKYNIKVYAGSTRLLSAADMQMDKYLGRLYIWGYAYNRIGLTRILFAIDELGVSELGPFDVSKPKMYENIGPVKDMLGEITAIVRVIEAKKACPPDSINQTYSKSTLKFETTGEQTSEEIYSVKEKVVEDLKKLAAMDTAKTKAKEFIGLIAKDGWEKAIEEFNELYGHQAEQNESDPNELGPPNEIKGVAEPFKLQTSTNLQRISMETIETLAAQTTGNPMARLMVNESKKRRLFIDQLYSLVPQDSNSVDNLPLVTEFKPDMSYYCLKEISVQRLSEDEYEKIKAPQAYKESYVQSQNLAAVYFNPENILKRMNFRWAEQDKKTTDANAPPESKEAS
jgi:hypothetical protein